MLVQHGLERCLDDLMANRFVDRPEEIQSWCMQRLKDYRTELTVEWMIEAPNVLYDIIWKFAEDP